MLPNTHDFQRVYAIASLSLYAYILSWNKITPRILPKVWGGGGGGGGGDFRADFRTYIMLKNRPKGNR